jgi:hypothetical protein
VGVRGEEVAEALPLSAQVAQIIDRLANTERDALDDFDPFTGESLELPRVVGEQTDPLKSKEVQHCRRTAVVAEVGFIAELEVGIHRVPATVLQRVGLQLR